ncbi:MAG: OsmC family protein [Thermoplasmatota archaeon]
MDVETATATPLTHVACRITARDLEWVQDKPAEFGGTNQGPMASELLLSSLLACQLSTYAKIAAKRKVTATANIDGALHLEDGDITKIHLTWKFSEPLEEKTAQTLMRLTDKVCTISRALSCPVTFEQA